MLVVSALPNTWSVCRYPSTIHNLSCFILAMCRCAGLISTLNASSCLQLLSVVVFSLLKFSLSVSAIKRKLVISKRSLFSWITKFSWSKQNRWLLLFFLDVFCSLALSGFSFTMYALDSKIKVKKKELKNSRGYIQNLALVWL